MILPVVSAATCTAASYWTVRRINTLPNCRATFICMLVTMTVAPSLERAGKTSFAPNFKGARALCNMFGLRDDIEDAEEVLVPIPSPCVACSAAVALAGVAASTASACSFNKNKNIVYQLGGGLGKEEKRPPAAGAAAAAAGAADDASAITTTGSSSISRRATSRARSTRARRQRLVRVQCV